MLGKNNIALVIYVCFNNNSNNNNDKNASSYSW
jgi:hypothetical protein